MANLILLDCLLRQVKKIGDQLDGRISFWYPAIVLLTSCINIVIILFWRINLLACVLSTVVILASFVSPVSNGHRHDARLV